MKNLSVTGRGVSVSDALRERVEDKLSAALSVFDIDVKSVDVVLRHNRNKSRSENETCEVTVFVPKSVVRVSVSDVDMYDAIDIAATKVARQLRKYKTKLVDKRKRDDAREKKVEFFADTTSQFADIILQDDDALVREKHVDVCAMSVEDAIVQCDLIGHDFYLFRDLNTDEVRVVYRRMSGGYGLIIAS